MLVSANLGNKELRFNKSLADSNGALTLNRFLSYCKDTDYFRKFQIISPFSFALSQIICNFATSSGRNPD